MFIHLWQELRDKLHENNDSTTQAKCKQILNDTLKDLANEYDWEFLTSDYSFTTTATSDGYSVDPIPDLSAAYTLYAQATPLSAGSGVITILGTRINADGSYDLTSDSISLIATATASGGISFSHIDAIRSTGVAGTVSITNSSAAVLATLSSTDREINYKPLLRPTGIFDVTKSQEIRYVDVKTALKGDPTGQFLGQSEYWTQEGDLFYLANVLVNTDVLMFYQKIPRTMILPTDTTEFPRNLWPKIVEAAYWGYGLRYEDEADAVQGMANYRGKLQECVDAWVSSRGNSSIGRSRVMPARVRRRPI
jgi:hypothetical protein